MSVSSKFWPKWLKIGILFFVGISLAVGLGYYRRFAAYDRAIYSVTLGGQSKTCKTVELDIAQQGLPKKLLQPDKVGIVAFTVKNANDCELNVIVQAEGFDGRSEIKVSGGIGMLPDGTAALQLNPYQAIHENPKLEVVIHPEQKEQYLISEGFIRFSDIGGVILAQVPVRIINSQHKSPAEHWI